MLYLLDSNSDLLCNILPFVLMSLCLSCIYIQCYHSVFCIGLFFLMLVPLLLLFIVIIHKIAPHLIQGVEFLN